MLARIQQAITLSLLAVAFGWLFYFWPDSQGLALVGFVAIVFGYAAFLAVEFVALKRINRHQTGGAASWAQLARAWVGETVTAPRVFCWRQPFRSNVVPDKLTGAGLQGRRGVVLVHGFVCNRGLWTPWLRRLQQQNHAFVAVNLEPVFGSIDQYVPIIEQAVRQVTQVTGLPPLLLCHSMGGLAARAWLSAVQADARVCHVVTIGTPHFGTWLGQFSTVTNGMQMRLQSDWLRRLQAREPPERYRRFTCWYSNCDNIVFPSATAMLPGARNQLVPGVAHMMLATQPLVLQSVLEALATDVW
ncbi:esterase/lipase family protein [Rhodoferax sp.]|uniref:esterase/lipase family protein n=1 Tax=Rhodoferax sp. TaxID=50421 RepID=UPI00275D787E|nr:alpha/beta fold hydrolase [Rhodoferax sp.]